MQELSSLFMTHRLIVMQCDELWPGHGLLYATKTREDNSKTKNARVVFHKVLELWPGHESGTYERSNRRGH